MRSGPLILLLGLAAALVAPPASTLFPDSASEPVTAAATNITLDVVAIDCPPGYDNGRGDGACLAYNGVIPGPPIVVEAFDRTRVTVANRIPDTIDALTVDAAVKDALRGTRISWHRHGVHVAAGMDGVDTPPGTFVVDSAVGPGATFTYESEHRYVGGWHYHDHVMFTGSAHAMDRGLFGALLVVAPGKQPDRVFDLHFLDTGPNGGLGLSGSAAAGEDFVIALAGLGNWWYDVTLHDPSGNLLSEDAVAPGVSFAWRVDDAVAGDYEWEATDPVRPGVTFRGEVRVA